MTLEGVEGEDRQDYTREESRAIRARSSRLLGSLLRPLRGRVVLAMLIVATSTALQTAGPALIAFGIDAGLPAILNHQDAMPLAVVVLLYLGAAIVGGRFVGPLLFRVSPRDPVVLGAVSGLMLAAAFAAALVPALRVRRIDPMLTLRSD